MKSGSKKSKKRLSTNLESRHHHSITKSWQVIMERCFFPTNILRSKASGTSHHGSAILHHFLEINLIQISCC